VLQRVAVLQCCSVACCSVACCSVACCSVACCSVYVRLALRVFMFCHEAATRCNTPVLSWGCNTLQHTCAFSFAIQTLYLCDLQRVAALWLGDFCYTFTSIWKHVGLSYMRRQMITQSYEVSQKSPSIWCLFCKRALEYASFVIGWPYAESIITKHEGSFVKEP